MQGLPLQWLFRTSTSFHTEATLQKRPVHLDYLQLCSYCWALTGSLLNHQETIGLAAQSSRNLDKLDASQVVDLCVGLAVVAAGAVVAGRCR